MSSMLVWLGLTCEGARSGGRDWEGRDEVHDHDVRGHVRARGQVARVDQGNDRLHAPDRCRADRVRELVFQQGLADPSQARTVRVQQGVPVATDGPFAESRESLVGFWVVDVENEARAVEIAARISRAADAAIEVRQCMDAPPDDVLEQIST